MEGIMQVSLSKEVQDFITSYSTQYNISHSQLIEEAILNMIEDLRDAKLAEEAYNEFIKSGEKGVSAKDLFEEMGL